MGVNPAGFGFPGASAPLDKALFRCIVCLMNKWAFQFILLFAIPLAAQTVKQAEIDSLKAELHETQARLDLLVRNNPIDLGERITKAYESGTKHANRAITIVGVIFGIVGLLGGILGVMGLGQAFKASKVLSEAREANIEVNNTRSEITRSKIEIENMFKEITRTAETVQDYEKETKGRVKRLTGVVNKVNRFGKKLEDLERDLTSLVYMVHGERHMVQREYKEALEIFEKAAEENPRNSEAWHMKGIALSKLDKYKEAILACKKAISLRPNDAKIYNSQAVILRKWGNSLKEVKQAESRQKYKLAIESLDKARALKKNSSAIYSNYASVLYELGDLRKALAASLKAISLNPKNAEAYLYCGRIFYKQLQYPKALEKLNVSIKLNPRLVLAHLLKGLTLYELNRLDEALVALDETSNLDPLNDSVYRFKAIIFATQEKYEDALEACEDALQIKPNEGVVHSNKAFLLNRLARYKEGKDTARKAIKLSKGANGHFAMACALSGLGELDEALKCLEESATRREYQGFIEGLGKDPWKEDSLKSLREERTDEFFRIVGPPPKKVKGKPQTKRKPKPKSTKPKKK